MSLKHFHMVFIVIAALCSLAFTAWVFLVVGVRAEPSIRMAGIVSAVIGVVLVGYGVWYVTKKSKGIIV